MPECKMFKHGVTINPAGSVRPCCMYDNIDMAWRYNEPGWREEFDRLYEESLSDEWNPRCHECKTEEEQNGWSLRKESNQIFDNTTQGTQYWDLKINNTCNLMCRMCSPNNSSTWKTQVKNSGHSDWDPFILREMDLKTGWHKDILPEMKHNLYDTKVLKFTGGEPMLVAHVLDIIKWCVEEDIAPGIDLRMTTNCTVDPDPVWFDLFKHFKNIHISMSIDAVGDRYNYVRAGGDWNITESNAIKFAQHRKQHHSMTCNLAFLPMSINAANEQDARDWCEKHNIHFHRSPECWRPEYLSYASLDETLRTRYNVNSDTPFDPAQFERLKFQMSLIDKLYDTSFKEQCPEFFG